MRSSIGIDVHKFSKNIPLVIGGVKIDFDKGLEGHSAVSYTHLTLPTKA